MKVIKNIWRTKGIGLNTLWCFGAIIKYKNDIWFVDLDDTTDEEAFNQYITDNSECLDTKYIAETEIHEKFCIEDYDPERYKYYYKDEKLTPYVNEDV